MFRRLVVIFLMDGQVALQDTSQIGFAGKGEAFEIYFSDFEYVSDKATLKQFKSALVHAKIDWLSEDSGEWVFDPVAFRSAIPDFEVPPWLQSAVVPNVDVRQKEDNFGGRNRRRASVFVEISRDEMTLKRNKIFLSHKSIDKDLVRKVALALKLSGYDPWLDENEMHAGAHLERSISEAFKVSLGAVFFITESFADNKYLASEIDYAIREKRERNEFVIIPIRFTKPDQATAAVMPDLLGTYVWKSVETGLDAFIEIMKALKHC